MFSHLPCAHSCLCVFTMPLVRGSCHARRHMSKSDCACACISMAKLLSHPLVWLSPPSQFQSVSRLHGWTLASAIPLGPRHHTRRVCHTHASHSKVSWLTRAPGAVCRRVGCRRQVLQKTTMTLGKLQFRRSRASRKIKECSRCRSKSAGKVWCRVKLTRQKHTVPDGPGCFQNHPAGVHTMWTSHDFSNFTLL